MGTTNEKGSPMGSANAQRHRVIYDIGIGPRSSLSGLERYLRWYSAVYVRTS